MQIQESLAQSNENLKCVFGPAFIDITPLTLAYRYMQMTRILKGLFIPKCHLNCHKFRLHLQLILKKGFV